MVEGFLYILYTILIHFTLYFVLVYSFYVNRNLLSHTELKKDTANNKNLSNVRITEYGNCTKYETRSRLSSKRDVKNEYPHLTQIIVILTHVTAFLIF